MFQLDADIFKRLNAEQFVGNQQPITYGEGGMSLAEIFDVERQLGFSMPEDFKYLLQNMRDPGKVMFAWQFFDKKKYDELIGWVAHGIEFDIQHNGFWLEARWGIAPSTVERRLETFRVDFPSWPKLLPLVGHRFLPADPCLEGNPVFSIMQTDIIYYGSNLAAYLLNEFLPSRDNHVLYTRDINVWSGLAG